jgi:hypothetical protein
MCLGCTIACAPLSVNLKIPLDLAAVQLDVCRSQHHQSWVFYWYTGSWTFGIHTVSKRLGEHNH